MAKKRNIKIEKNIPLPPTIRGFDKDSAFPFKKMKLGDSFIVPLSDKKNLMNAASATKRKGGFNYTTRSSAAGVRIWKIKSVYKPRVKKIKDVPTAQAESSSPGTRSF